MDNWGQNDQVVSDLSDVYTRGKDAKYSPDQMAELNRRRDELLADPITQEYNTGIESPKQEWGVNDKVVEAEWGKNDKEVTSLKPKTPVADIVGGAAAGLDTVLPVGTALGGLHGLNRLLTGQGMAGFNRALEQTKDLNLGSALEKFYPEAYERYKAANEPVEKFGEFAHEAGGKVTDITGSPALGAATNVAAQALPFVLGERALTKGTIRPNATELKKGLGYDKPYEEPTIPKQSTHVSFEELAQMEKDAQTASATPELKLSKKQIGEYNKSRKQVKDPLEEATVENYNRGLNKDQYALDLEGEMNHPMRGETTGTPDLFDMDATNHIGRSSEEVKADQIDQAWESYNRDKEIGQLIEKGQLSLDQANPKIVRDLLEEPKEIEIKRMKGQMKFGSSQRGGPKDVVNNDTIKRLQALKESSLHIERDREAFQKGQTVRLMNGKTGRITNISEDGRYQIQGRDFTDSVPVQGIDYAYKPAGMQATMPYGQTKFGKSQRGAIDLSVFVPEKLLKFARENLTETLTKYPKSIELFSKLHGFKDALMEQALYYYHTSHPDNPFPAGFDRYLKNKRTLGNASYGFVHTPFDKWLAKYVREVPANWQTGTPSYYELHLPENLHKLAEEVHAELMQNDPVFKSMGGEALEFFSNGIYELAQNVSDAIASSEKSRGSPFKGPGKNQSGAVNFGAMFGKDKANISDIKFDESTYKDILWNLRESSDSPLEFKEKLRLFSKEPDFVKNFVDNSDALYESIPKGKRPESNFSKLDSEGQRASADFRSWETMKEENGYTKKDKNGKPIPFHFKATDDMSGVKALWQPSHILSQGRAETVKVYKNVLSRLQNLKNLESKQLMEMRENLIPFAKLSRDDMGGLTQAMINYDGMRNDTLQAAGLQWATPEMLRKDGLSEKQIAAYQSITKGLDRSYELIDLAFKMFGRQPPERIPGYFPHFWTGSWRVHILDEKGAPIEIKPFATRLQAKMAMMKAEKQGFQTQMIPPESHLKEANFVPELIQALQVFKNKKGLNGKILEKLLQLNEYTQRGIVKDVLEREGVKGYDAEKGILPEVLGYNRWHNNRLIKAYDTHFENVARFWSNVQIIKDVAGPLYRDFDMFEHTPNFRDAVTDLIGRATGNEVNHASKVDQFIRATMIKAGLPVHGTHEGLFHLNRYMTWSKLNSTNSGFVMSNLVQPALAISDLMQIHQDRINAGLKTANPYKAMSVLFKELVDVQQGTGSKEFKEALKWAKDNGKIDTSAAFHADPLRNLSIGSKSWDAVFHSLGRVVENRGRATSFLAAYSYFKDVLPKKEALEAAANRMNIMMGNYERMNASAMYTDYGILGTAIKPFAQLRNTYYGRAGQALATAKEGKGRPGALAPFAIMMGNYLFGAGVIGVLGAAEYDKLAELYNSILEPESPLPTTAEWARKAGLPDWMIFGSLGKMTGVNIGPSVAAPAFAEGAAAPGLQAAENFGSLGIQLGKLALTGETNTEKVYSAVKRLAPPMLAPWIEEYISEKQGGNIPHSSNLDATRPRTEEESQLFKAFGKRAITEEEDRQVQRLNKIENAQNSKWKKGKVNEIVSSMLDYSISMKSTQELIENALEADKGFDAKTLRQNIKEELKRRVTPEDIRNLQSIAKSSNSAEKLRKLKQIQDLMRAP